MMQTIIQIIVALLLIHAWYEGNLLTVVATGFLWIAGLIYDNNRNEKDGKDAK